MTAASLYKKVKSRAEGEGPVCMITLMQEVLKIQCSPNELLTITAKRICDTVHRIFAIKALDEDMFKNAARAANSVLNVQTDKGKVPPSGGKVYTQLAGLGGKVYLVEDGDLRKLQTLSSSAMPTPIGFTSLATNNVLSPLPTTDDSKWEGWMAIIEEEDLRASVD
ncbi:hypothetical protein C0992_002452 [Termitomyces sp. T32_za158]|nr:hypothetical protein C0992_002452 [Termitomyces sp. T32_za158]